MGAWDQIFIFGHMAQNLYNSHKMILNQNRKGIKGSLEVV